VYELASVAAARRARRRGKVAVLERRWAADREAAALWGIPYAPPDETGDAQTVRAGARQLVEAWERGEDSMMGFPRPDDFTPILKALADA
jgi:hypothetical protein